MIITHENGIDTISNDVKLKNKKPTYKIFLLDDDDFNDLYKDLPYMKKEKLKTSLGFANPKTNEAYVRKTGVAQLDDSTIEHELQELLVKVSPDEEDGIRYKSGAGLGRILGPIVGAILTPFIGPAGIAVGAAISGGTQAHSQKVKPEKFGTGFGGIAKAGVLGGLGAAAGSSLISGGVAGGTAAAPGFLSKAIGIGKGALLGTPATSGISTGGSSVAGAAPAGATTFAPATKGLLGRGGSFFGSGTAASKATELAQASTIPGAASPIAAVGTFAGNPLGRTNTLRPSVASNITSPTAPTISGVGANTVAATAPSTTITTAPTSLASSIKSFASKPANILGSSLVAGSFLPKSPEFQFPQQFTDLQAKLQSGEGGLSELGQQARTELSGILSATPNELFPEANQAFLDATFRQFDERFNTDKAALDARYNAAGVFGSGEHLAAVDKLEQQYTNLRADTTAQINQRNFELGRTEKYNAIQTSLGVDKGDMDALLGLTGFSVELASQIYNVKVADVTELRKTLGTLGSELILRGSGLEQPNTTNINIGSGLAGLLGGN